MLLQQVLAIHQDEDRDVEGNAAPLAVIEGETLDQRLREVVPVEAWHRQIRLVLVVLDGIDRVGRESRDP